MMTHRTLRSQLISSVRRLRRDESGLALIEFAYVMPVVFTLGMLGLEIANFALTNMKVSQIALALADNASRVGETSALSLKRLRERDINDVLQGARLQAQNMKILQNGRVTLSSLEVNDDGGQWIHWQRCIGMKPYDSSYGTAGDGMTGTDFPGMGKPGKEVKAPPQTAVMFVEINYDYQPIIAGWLLGQQRIHSTASFIVRDQRDLTQVYNTAPTVTPSDCDTYPIEEENDPGDPTTEDPDGENENDPIPSNEL